MLLHAVIVPPRNVTAALARVVRSVDGSAAAAAPPPPRKRFLVRRGGRGDPAVDPSNSHAGELEFIPPQLMSLTIVGFGNVTTADAVRLTRALRTEAVTWPRPTVHVSGGGALEFAEDRSVWAKLAGDVASLSAIARGVTQSVEPVGFFVDRRKFRPSLAVATVTDRTTTPYLQSVLDALDAFRGEDWTVEYVSLMGRSFEEGGSKPEEVDRISLSPS